MKYTYGIGVEKDASNIFKITAAILLTAALVLGAYAVVEAKPTNSQGGDAHRGNSLKSEAVPMEITSVVAEVSDPSASNFEEEFTYYVIRFENVENQEQWTYREPARLGGENFVASAGYPNAFWFGVSAPDEDGIQHEIEHKGQVNMYYETDDTTYSITAQFNGQGELLHVNGVQPE